MYLSDTGLSLYDFAHSDAQMVTWMRDHPGGKGFAYRANKKAGSSGQKGMIGRAVSEPCFGNGEEAREVIYQELER